MKHTMIVHKRRQRYHCNVEHGWRIVVSFSSTQVAGEGEFTIKIPGQRISLKECYGGRTADRISHGRPSTSGRGRSSKSASNDNDGTLPLIGSIVSLFTSSRRGQGMTIRDIYCEDGKRGTRTRTRTRIRRGRSDDREEDKKEMNGGKIKGGRKGEGGGKEEREHGPIKAIYDGQKLRDFGDISLDIFLREWCQFLEETSLAPFEAFTLDLISLSLSPHHVRVHTLWAIFQWTMEFPRRTRASCFTVSRLVHV